MAVISSLFQLVQSRMTLPPHDPAMADDANYKIQRQMAYIFPFISLIYGSFLPAGLFLYWITSTVFSVIQQYLIIGWGGMFPLFGWTPSFAQGHAPRFPVVLPGSARPAFSLALSARSRSVRTIGSTAPNGWDRRASSAAFRS